MKISKKQKSAFTLMEIIATLIFIFIISILIVMIELSRINSSIVQKKEFSLKSIKDAVGTIISNGYVDENGLMLKQIPPVGHTPDKKGFCDVVANLLHASGSIDCTAPAVADLGPFDITTMNFQTTNGLRYFNLAKMANKNYYAVYIDVTGERGNEKLGQDVIKYYITLDGQVLNKAPIENKDAAEQIEKLSKILDVEK